MQGWIFSPSMAHTTAWRKTFFHTGKKKDFFPPVSDEGTAGQVRWRKKKKNGKKVFFPRDVIKRSPEGEKLEPKCRYKRALLLAGARHRRLTEMERKKTNLLFSSPPRRVHWNYSDKLAATDFVYGKITASQSSERA